MATTFFFNKDVAVLLKFEINNPDGTDRDLTGATVTLRTEDTSGTIKSFTCTITDATTGKCQYSTTTDDFAEGTYRAQVRAVFASQTYHTEVFTIKVGKAIT